MPLILENASFTYSAGRAFAVDAVREVTLSVNPGKLTLIVGATGSGKSTLMRLAAGLLEPRSGSATIDGERVTPESTRGRVGLIFQDAESQLFADTLLDDVAFGPRNLGVDHDAARAQAEEALAAVGLDPQSFGGRSPFSLSGGETRRAAIAGVLAMRPRYLLADEPTAGLDAQGRRAVRRLLLEQRKSAGVVVVTHVAEEFLGEADELVVLVEGRVEWSGPARDAVADPFVLSRCGLRAPSVLEVQRLATQCGVQVGGFTLDPIEAARNLASARGLD